MKKSVENYCRHPFSFGTQAKRVRPREREKKKNGTNIYNTQITKQNNKKYFEENYVDKKSDLFFILICRQYDQERQTKTEKRRRRERERERERYDPLLKNTKCNQL